MAEKMDKVLQIRLSNRELEMIKKAFIGTNISNMVRMYLVNQALEILDEEEKEEVDDFVQFRNYITKEETIKEMYENFKLNQWYDAFKSP